MVRILGISASPRRANTEILVKESLDAAAGMPFDVETEFVSFVGKKIEPCTDCAACVRNKDYCWKKDDWLELVSPLLDTPPDGLIIGAPVYFYSVNSMLRAFFERCTCLFKQLWHEDFPHTPPDWTKTAAGALAVGFHRHGGVENALTNILQVMLSNGFVCVGGDYIGGAAWQMEIDSREAVKEDEIGLTAARQVGKRVAYTAHLLQEGRKTAEDIALLKIG